MLELLSPAGSPEAVIAAVQNGADAIYLGVGDFNARRGAKNFTEEEFEKAVRYCRIRGCKTYLTLNTLVNDRETEQAVNTARLASRCGADGIIIQDLGLIELLRRTVPDIPLHASTQMTIHNLAGVQAAAEMGLTRAVLARELSLEQIKYICKNSPIEIEVLFTALCASVTPDSATCPRLSAGAAETAVCARSRAACSILSAAGWTIILSRSRTTALSMS